MKCIEERAKTSPIGNLKEVKDLREDKRRNPFLIKQRSLKINTDFQKKREETILLDENHSSYKEMKHAQINLLLENVNSKKDTDPIQLLNTAQKVIDCYPEDFFHIYTDG